MNILDKKISSFNNTKSTEVSHNDLTIGDYLNAFKTGVYSKQIKKVREGNKFIKTNELETIAFHGVFDGWRKKDLFIEASGLIILDIDDIEDDIEEIKEEIMEGSDHVLAVMVSPSGNGVKILYYVTPELITAENYNAIGKKLVDQFTIYGKVDYLSVTDTLIATYDPKILINKDATPDFVYIKEVEKKHVELPVLDKGKSLWEDIEDFFDTVLANEILSRTNNNYHYIQVSLLELAKFGFYHPQEDLEFVIDYAENEFGSDRSKNQQRFKEISRIAKDYAQTAWPYNTTQDQDIGDDEYVDYSEHIPDNDEKSDSSEPEQNNFVDYSKMFSKVVATVKEGNRVGYEIALKDFANIMRFKGSGIFTWTGIPTHGKSEFIDAIIIDLWRLHGQQTLIAGFEQSPEEHIVKLARKMEGKDIRCKTWIGENPNRLERLYDFVTKGIIHLDTNKTGGNINVILESFAKKISELRENGGDPKYIVLDLFNMLSISGKFSGHEKIEEILRRITHFSHQMNVMVFLVAHPFKMKKDEKTGIYEVPDFYSVKGSSAFFEMSYHGAVVYRTNTTVMVKILKVKQNNLGNAGECCYFLYDKNSGRYIPSNEDGDILTGTHRDTDWLEKAFK